MADDPWSDFRTASPVAATEDGPWAAFRSKPAEHITASNLVRQAGKGIPIVGGLLNKANAATYAALEPVTRRLGGANDPTISHADDYFQRYAEDLAREEAKDTSFEAQHPIASTAAQVTGGVASTIPLGATQLGARALGMGGTTLPGQIGRGIASGAGVNTADALVRGNDPIAAAGIGSLVGGAAPVVSRVVGAVADPVIRTVRGIVNPADQAARNVSTAVGRDIGAGTAGLTPAEFQAAQARGQPVTTMDVGGDLTRAVARSAANTSPEARGILNQPIDARFEGQSNRLEGWLNDQFHYPNAHAQQEAIDRVQSTTNNLNYRRAMREGQDGVWSPELETLAGSPAVTKAMQAAATKYKDEAIIQGGGAFNPKVTFSPDGRMQTHSGPGGVPVYPDLQFWDLTRRELSDAASEAQRAGRNSEYRRLSQFANRMNTALDAQVPSYAQARAGAAHFFGAENALDAGRTFVTSRLGNDEARAALANMSTSERQLFQDGFVSEFIKNLREQPNRRNILNQVSQSPAALERLNMVMGPQRARELEAFLRVEHVMDQARNAVQGNSTTARQLAELGLAGGTGLATTGGGNPLSDPQAVVNTMLTYGALRGRSAINQNVAQHVARMLTSGDPRQVQRAITQIGMNGSLINALRHADIGLARSAAIQGEQR